MTKPIVKRSYNRIEEDLIYSYVSIGSYLPMGYSISVYDRENNNVIIKNDYFDVGNNIHPSFDNIHTLPVKETKTLGKTDLDKIKKLILENKVLEIRHFDEPDYMVLDGSRQRIYFCVDGKRKYIEGDNLFSQYTNNPEVRRMEEAVDEIDRIIESV